MNISLNELAARIEASLPERVRRVVSNPRELTYEVAANDLIGVCRSLRDEPTLKFEMLMDVCGVDYLHYGHDEWKTFDATETGFSRGVARGAGRVEDPEDTHERFDPTATYVEPEAQRPRFAVVYHLQSITHNVRVRLRAFCADDAHPMIDSVIGIWSSADWFERETFDMYGILFRGHPDLRRILTDYGFVGHPFRKDFPLSGNVEVRYDAEKKRVVYQPVSIEPRTLVPKVIREDNRYAPELKDVKRG